MDAETAFAAYEAVRHRLPLPAKHGDPPVRVSSMADLTDAFDVFLLDAFGVLNIGASAIPGVAERIEALQALGKRVIVVSNAAGLPHAGLVEKYERLGYRFAPEDVVTSRAALLAGIEHNRDIHWGLMSARSTGLRDLEALNLTYLEEDAGTYEAVDGFLMIGSTAWTEERQSLLVAALQERPRPVLVGNPDIVAPRDVGFSTEPGHFAHRLADETGVVPEFFGKPFSNIFDLVFRRIGEATPRDRVVMVGDSLHTDILGAQTAGIGSALVAGYGFFAGHDLSSAIERSGIVPDYVLDRP